MNYQELYQQKLTTAEEAVKVVKSGDWVDYSWCCNHPVALDKALAARKDELFDVKIRGGVTMWMPEVCKADDAGDHFTWNSWHCSGVDRKIIGKGMGYFGPMRYSELPRFYRDGNATTDVAMIQVTPMDAHGNFSFAVSASHIGDMLEHAKKIIVEVNQNMPWVYGLTGTEINIRDVDMVVEGENPAVAAMGADAPPTDVDRKVAEMIVKEIPNGACLQLGIGGMPNTVGSLIAESDLKDLGVHTEMYVDAFVDIAKAGKITGRNKNVDRGRQVYAFAAGTQKLYDYIKENPDVMAAPVDYTNDVQIIAKLDNFISINNAVDMDLFGQVNAESAGIKHISGTGGQLDFVMGAYLSKGGKSFICMSAKFHLTYVDKDGSEKTPVVLHRAILGSLDRFMAYLIEETKGKFPTWLAPTQVKVLPVSEKTLEYAQDVTEKLSDAGIRVVLDDDNQKIGYKIRAAQQVDRVPYMLVLGAKEAEAGNISVRDRKGETTEMSLEDFIAKVTTEIRTRSL